MRLWLQVPQHYYEGSDMRLAKSDWRDDAEAHLRDVVREQQRQLKWLESELARTRAFVYQAVGE